MEGVGGGVADKQVRLKRDLVLHKRVLLLSFQSGVTTYTFPYPWSLSYH